VVVAGEGAARHGFGRVCGSALEASALVGLSARCAGYGMRVRVLVEGMGRRGGAGCLFAVLFFEKTG
jgi:hypothetical protein